jgi:hypothetical protein
MIGLLFALFCAISLIFVGDLGRAPEMSVGILLIWGLGIFMMPRPVQHGWKLLAGAALVRLILLPVDSGLEPTASLLLSDAGALWDGANPYEGSRPSAFLPLKLWIVAPFGGEQIASWPLKLGAIGCDLGVVWLLAKVLRSRKRQLDAAWLYALHPLGAVEAAVHGGLSSLVMVCALLAVLAWTLGRSGLGWASLGGLLGGLPLAMIPGLRKGSKTSRSPFRTEEMWILAGALGLTAILFWPVIGAGTGIWTGISQGLQEPGLPGIIHMLLSWIDMDGVTAVCAIGGLLLLVQIWMRWRDPIDLLLWTAAAWILLAPTVAPGAILWVWIPALVCGVRACGLLAILAPLSYLCLPSAQLNLLSSSDTEWLPWVVFLPFLSSFGVEYLRHLSRPGPWQAGPARNTLPLPSRT